MTSSRRRRRAAFGVVALVLFAHPGAAPAQSAARTRTTAELLVDLARDHGLRQRGRQTAADVLHVRALLRAAVELDPRQTDAYVWLYELALLEGDQAEAGRVLTALLQADREHEGVFGLWLREGLRRAQTVEQRVAWLEALTQTERPPAMQAMVHVAFAGLALEGLDTQKARLHARRALELQPADPEAAAILLATLPAQAAIDERLAAILRVLQVNPLAPSLAWEAGVILDRHGLSAEGRTFLTYARDLYRRLDPANQAPGALLIDLSHNLLACGEIEEAIHAARGASMDPAAAAEALWLAYDLYARTGRVGEAARIKAGLAQRFAAVRDPERHELNEVAQAAWFHCTIDPQPQRALMLAEAAFARAPNEPFVRRVLGWAQALNERFDLARQTLEPIAAADAFAACRLAQIHVQDGDRDAARRVVAALDPPPPAGLARDVLASLDLWGEPALPTTSPATQPGPLTQPSSQPVTESEPPPQPAQTQPASQPASGPRRLPSSRHQDALRAALGRFDAGVLRFFDAPESFLRAELRMDRVDPRPGEPWRATFSLTNDGSFPITLGPDAMVNPVFLLSYQMQGDRERAWPALTTVSLDRVRVLYPGQSTREVRTLDVGPALGVCRNTPQHVQRVTVRAVLNAERAADGQWRTGWGGQVLRPAVFNRLPTTVDAATLRALFNALAGGDRDGRFAALELAGELLGEHQRAAAGSLNYNPQTVPADRLRGVLLNYLGSEDWEYRVRTLEAVQVVGLGREMIDAVERCLRHEHWLVRLMALRVLARQGPAFADRAAAIARDDPHERVRELAQSYVQGWQAAGVAETPGR